MTRMADECRALILELQQQVRGILLPHSVFANEHQQLPMKAGRSI